MSIRVPLLASLAPPLPERDCKGTTFFFPSSNFFPTFFRAGHRRQARQTAETPVWHAVARLRPQVGFFRCPDKKIVTRTDRRPHTEKGHAQHGRSSLRSTGGTQPRDATATHMWKCWPDGGCRPNIKKRPDRHSSQAPLSYPDVKVHVRHYIMPPIPAAGAATGSFSGISAIAHSVVRNIPATEAAFSRATRETLVGSMTPASYMLTYSSVLAL